jgi:hypothetical protein
MMWPSSSAESVASPTSESSASLSQLQEDGGKINGVEKLCCKNVNN